jgi:hypothetical protein
VIFSLADQHKRVSYPRIPTVAGPSPQVCTGEETERGNEFRNSTGPALIGDVHMQTIYLTQLLIFAHGPNTGVQKV